MSDPVLDKRDNHCFISYASEDGALAQRIAKWLGEAGLRIWFDQIRLGAGASVVDELARQVCNSRAFLLVATEKALTKNYVAHEVNIACDQQITQPGFTIVAVRTNPELDLSTRFPSLRKVSWMSVPEGKLDVAVARRILLALAPSIPAAPETRHIYVSCGWSENEEPVTRRVCAPLVTRHVRLIGDAKDQKKFGEFGEEGAVRVERIMSGCTGHLLILPARRPPGKTPEEAYKYFLAEWELGRRLGLERRTFLRPSCFRRSCKQKQLRSAPQRTRAPSSPRSSSYTMKPKRSRPMRFSRPISSTTRGETGPRATSSSASSGWSACSERLSHGSASRSDRGENHQSQSGLRRSRLHHR